jgi:hypothetical protein
VFDVYRLSYGQVGSVILAAPAVIFQTIRIHTYIYIYIYIYTHSSGTEFASVGHQILRDLTQIYGRKNSQTILPSFLLGIMSFYVKKKKKKKTFLEKNFNY